MCLERNGFGERVSAGVQSVTAAFFGERKWLWWAAELRRWKRRCICPDCAAGSFCWSGVTGSGEARLAERVQKTENIAVMMNTQVQEILGETSVTGLGLSRAGQEEILAVSGVFEAIGGQPDTDWLPDWLPRDENGYLLAGEDCKTPCSGVYAAGDVRKKPLRQVIAAMADGAVAAEAAGKQRNPPTGW